MIVRSGRPGCGNGADWPLGADLAAVVRLADSERRI